MVAYKLPVNKMLEHWHNCICCHGDVPVFKIVWKIFFLTFHGILLKINLCCDITFICHIDPTIHFIHNLLLWNNSAGIPWLTIKKIE